MTRPDMAIRRGSGHLSDMPIMKLSNGKATKNNVYPPSDHQIDLNPTLHSNHGGATAYEKRAVLPSHRDPI